MQLQVRVNSQIEQRPVHRAQAVYDSVNAIGNADGPLAAPYEDRYTQSKLFQGWCGVQQGVANYWPSEGVDFIPGWRIVAIGVSEVEGGESRI